MKDYIFIISSIAVLGIAVIYKKVNEHIVLSKKVNEIAQTFEVCTRNMVEKKDIEGFLMDCYLQSLNSCMATPISISLDTCPMAVAQKTKLIADDLLQIPTVFAQAETLKQDKKQMKKKCENRPAKATQGHCYLMLEAMFLEGMMHISQSAEK